MSTFKTCEVVILPATKKVIGQEIYILSNEPIVKGDWAIETLNKVVFKCNSNNRYRLELLDKIK